MSLFIVSQNKKQIKKLNDSIEIKDNIEFNPNNPNGIQEPKYVSSSIYVDGINFGTYASQEQAIKVVQEIRQKLLNKTEQKKQPSSKAKENKNVDNEPAVKGVEIDVVYEMPKI